MAKIDWIIHSVFGTLEDLEYIQNNHTHGMERYGHLDFQILLNLGPQEVGRLLNTMGLRVQSGEKFAPGDLVSGLYLDCDIRLDKVLETGREVLRLVIPDKYNHFPEHPLCEAPYCNQTKEIFT